MTHGSSIGRSTRSFATAVALAGLWAIAAGAEQGAAPQEGHGWWAEVDLGYGRLERHAQSTTLYNDSFAMSLAGGLRVTPHVMIGLDLGGYGLQSTCASTPAHFCTPSELERGKGLEHLLFVADYRPAIRDGWLLHAGLGMSGYWDQAVSQYYNRDNSYGWAAELGTGYTWRLGSRGHLGLRAGYEFGHLSGGQSAGVPAFDYGAFKLMLNCAYY